MKEVKPVDDPLGTAPATEQSVVEFLQQHGDFFVRHPGLLAELNLPHGAGRTVSLVEHQVGILRERNVDMRRRMNELVHTARQNDRIFSKTRSLTLALLEAKSRQALNEVLATHVVVDFEADFVCCHLIGNHGSLDHIRSYASTLPFSGQLNPENARCATLRQDELRQLFPHADHSESGSAALVPLQMPSSSGLLCIGSRNPQHFSANIDTLFVTYIADVLAKVLATTDA